MTPRCLLCLLGSCLLSHWARSSNLNCNQEQYEHGTRCCSRCGPGRKLLSDCTELAHSGCTECEEGHFQAGWTKEKHCTPHKYCDPNAGLVTRLPGDAKHNAVCGCQAGTYCSNADCQTCLPVSACEPGYGVVQKASNYSDTVCVACKHGNFSSTVSASEPCRPWTSCGALGLVMKATGTNLSDVLCEASRSRSSVPVLIPVMAAMAACLVLLIFYWLHRNGLQRCTQKQGAEPPEAVDLVAVPRAQHPAEVHYEEHDERQDFPVQETLLGRQPVAQEDGKESRISEQERL
ncbi:tumor necrosis factor receptor superfamily member 5 [Emydura macquarii macquarii]|uniref:tumor necrosis factor receptor superfamily member 5 n=1 Tax=Emydura macquarii macquarii TaxID=1129001 RepID=UPI00352AF62B